MRGWDLKIRPLQSSSAGPTDDRDTEGLFFLSHLHMNYGLNAAFLYFKKGFQKFLNTLKIDII